MFGLEKLADWWDEQKKISEQALDRFVEDHPDWFGITVATATHTVMTLGQGFVDVLRIGEGVKEGGWGYAKDGLRVLSLAGPAARISRMGLARVTPNPGGNICAWVTTAKALRQTGTKHFATAADLMQAAGHSAAPTSMAEMTGVLRSFGAQVHHLGNPQSFTQLQRMVAASPYGVVMFGVRWRSPTGIPHGHALYAFRDVLGRFRIADRTGVIASTLEELESLVLQNFGRTYNGIGQATPQGAAVFVRNSSIIQGTTLASVLALEVRSVILTDKATAATEIHRLRAAPPSGGGRQSVYTVVSGDSLSKIAQHFYGNVRLWTKIYEANMTVIGPNPNLIHPGQKLVIPQ